MLRPWKFAAHVHESKVDGVCGCPSRRAGVAWVELDGDVVLTDTATGVVHVLRGAAAAVWQLLDGEPIADLPELVAEAFAIDAVNAAKDIGDAIEMLAAIDVVSCAGPGD